MVLYFQAGRKGTFYIMPKDFPSKVNIDNVEKSLQYMQSRIRKDKEIHERLLELLPKERRKDYAKVSD